MATPGTHVGLKMLTLMEGSRRAWRLLGTSQLGAVYLISPYTARAELIGTLASTDVSWPLSGHNITSVAWNPTDRKFYFEIGSSGIEWTFTIAKPTEAVYTGFNANTLYGPTTPGGYSQIVVGDDLIGAAGVTSPANYIRFQKTTNVSKSTRVTGTAVDGAVEGGLLNVGGMVYDGTNLYVIYLRTTSGPVSTQRYALLDPAAMTLTQQGAFPQPDVFSAAYWGGRYYIVRSYMTTGENAMQVVELWSSATINGTYTKVGDLPAEITGLTGYRVS